MAQYLSKRDMARTVVTALYNCAELVGPDDVRVVWMVNKHTRAWLEPRYTRALRILDARNPSED